jgi:16S rRNA (guanine527-N7)-methyltransferase
MFHVKQFDLEALMKAEIVSRETISHLKIYQTLLETWQNKINLVSSSTLSHLWERHFEDSLQLLPLLPKTKATLLDLGSGAGFPGLVLSIVRGPILEVTLVESDLRKCLFLENVSRETFSSVKILRSRIESLSDIKADIITARALAPLPRLLRYAHPLMKETSFCLFLKGEGVEKEIQEAKKNWEFDLEIIPSLTDCRGKILKISSLKGISPYV